MKGEKVVKSPPPPRLSLIQARRAPVAVIFRRGPSKDVEILRWDLASDAFERGHWFHGRIYEKRSDLSPDGELLVYFASKYGRRTHGDASYTDTWTAVSRVPWLTALALWPKGDCWWGGGLFSDDRSLWLNHRPDEATAHPDHPPGRLKVEPNPQAHGESEPIYSRRLERDGWTLRQALELEPPDANRGYRTITPEQRVKHLSQAATGIAIVLERRVDRYTSRASFRIEGVDRAPELPPGPMDWLDWDARGRLIALTGGRVWAAELTDGRVGRFRELLDLRPDRPEAREAPAEALRW